MPEYRYLIMPDVHKRLRMHLMLNNKSLKSLFDEAIKNYLEIPLADLVDKQNTTSIEEPQLVPEENQNQKV